MPGGLTDELEESTLDYNKLRVVVFDERARDETARLELHSCGDGIYNQSSLDEQCDNKRVPPAG